MLMAEVKQRCKGEVGSDAVNGTIDTMTKVTDIPFTDIITVYDLLTVAVGSVAVQNLSLSCRHLEQVGKLTVAHVSSPSFDAFITVSSSTISATTL